MDFRNFLLFLVFVLDLVFAFVIYSQNRKREINISYALTAIWASLWTLGIVAFRVSSSYFWQLFWNREFIFTSGLIASSFLHFSLLFPYRERLKNWQRFLIYLPNTILLWAVLVPGVLIENIVIRTWGNESILGWGYIYFGIYFAIIWLWSSLNLLRNYFNSQGIHRVQIIYVLIGVSFAIVFGATFNLIFILLGNYRFIWLGPYASFIFVVFTTYAIFKHHLFNIKVIATEIFSTLLVIVTLTDLFTAKSPQELAYKLTLFAAVLTFAVLLIRSVLAEVRRREELQKLSDRLAVANLKLQDANRHLKELLKMKSEFITIASHQLRTPLTAIRGLLDMQAKGDFDRLDAAKRKDLQKDMLLAANRLNNIVNDLLDALEVEGGLHLEFKPVDIAKIIQEAIKTLQFNYDKKKLYLKFEKIGLIPKIEAADKYAREIFVNLIDNAEKYMEAGGTTVTVKQVSDKIEVRVKDTGIGITKEDYQRLFEKFSRGKKAALIHTDGSGLGLFIVKKIVGEHHGTIKFESEGLGKGTTFIVNLPIKQPK